MILRTLPVTALLLLQSLSLSAFAGAGQTGPNVIFILVDDWGWYDAGYNGSTFYETPEIDRLAEQWMRFDYCYTASPMCSPMRVSLLTGKNPARHGVTQWLPGTSRAFTRNGEQPRVHCPKPAASQIQHNEVTLGEAFADAGYDTAFYGKWHMGPLASTGGPARHGYAAQLAVIETNRCSMFYPFRNNKNYFPDAKQGDYFTDKLTDAAIEYVTQKRDKPFYLHLCHFAMHAPIESKPDLKEKYAEKAKQLAEIEEDRVLDQYAHKPYKLRQDEPAYAGELENLDTNIGRLIAALKASGQYDDTIVVLTGDNGGRSAFFHSPPTSNSPLRAGKTYLFEGGIRTPCLIHWPGHTKAGTSTSTPVTTMDFYPTLLEMAGLAAKTDQHVDGVSLVPLIQGQQLSRDTLYWHFPHYQGEGAYPTSAIRQGPYKLIVNYHHDDELLFDIRIDPNETTSLADQMPEKVAALKQKLMNFLTEAGATIPKPPAEHADGTNSQPQQAEQSN